MFSVSLTPESGDSSVGIATGYGLDDRSSRVRFPARAGNFYFRRVQNCSGVHPASYPMDNMAVKRPEHKAGHLPPSSSDIKDWVKLYLHSPSTPSWRGAQLKKHRDAFTITFFLNPYTRNCSDTDRSSFHNNPFHLSIYNLLFKKFDAK
jgi:hypothetical protein